MNERALIVNADDFGLSSGVNRGIARAFREGILTSTTLLANQPGFDEAVALALGDSRIRVGVHLTLVWGAPVSPRTSVPSLVDGRGQLPAGLAPVVRRYLTGTLDLEQVKQEFRAQIRKVEEAGLTPTHADTHKHVHCLPGVMGAFVQVAREAGLGRVRLPLERPATLAGFRPSWTSTAKRRLLAALLRHGRATIEAAGLRTTDHFLGVAIQDRLNSKLLCSIFPGLPSGVTELMCHPGHDEGHCARGSAVLDRERELEALCDPEVAKRLEAEGIRLMGYGEL